VSLTGDHSEICKFSGKDDENWLKVGPQLEKYYRNAVAVTQTAQHMPIMEQPTQGISRPRYTRQSLLKRRLVEFLDALNSRELMDSQHEITVPLDGTCDWFLKEPRLKAWIDPTTQLSLLSIQGSLGSGKSTLMRFLVTHLRNMSWSSHTVAAVFNSSKENAVRQNAPAEILRTLLIQLLCHYSFREDAAAMLNTPISKILLQDDVHNYQQELCSALGSLFRTRRSHQTFLCIDAVEKCPHPDILLQLIEDLDSVAAAANLKICITSQQTIPLLDSRCEKVVVDHMNHGDIKIYVERRLAIQHLLTQQQQTSLQEAITQKASGVFLWVVLVVNLLRGYLSEGKDYPYLLAAIYDTPQPLVDLYRSIIARSKQPEKPLREFILIMHWVLFSARSLTLPEWHHVLAFVDNPCLLSIKEWKQTVTYTESDSLLLQRVQRVCCGFVNVEDRQLPQIDTRSLASSVGVGAGSFESYHSIEVAHSSIRKFFLDEGGYTLLGATFDNSIGSGHSYILEVCLRYSFLEEMRAAFDVQLREREASAKKTLELPKAASIDHTRHRASRMPKRRRRRRSTVGDDVDDALSETMSLGSSAGNSVRSFRSDDHRPRGGPEQAAKSHIFSNMIKSMSTTALELPKSGRSMKAVSDYVDGLVTASEDLFPRPHMATTADRVESRTASWLEAVVSSDGEPVSYAAQVEHAKAVEDPPNLWQYCQNMLVHHAVSAQEAKTVPESALDFLLEQDINIWAATRDDMQYGATLQYFAAQWNLVSWLQWLVQQGRIANPKGGLHVYPIIVAARRERLETFAYLLDQTGGAGLTYRDEYRRTALHYAAMSLGDSILAHICEAFPGNMPGVDMQDQDGRTALHLATLNASNERIVKLRNSGANADLLDVSGHTPLQLACNRKDCFLSTCQSLANHGRELSQQNIRVALKIAEMKGSLEILAYLTDLQVQEKAQMRKPLSEQPATDTSDNAEDLYDTKYLQVLRNFFTKAALVIVSSRADLPLSFNSAGDVRIDKWVRS
jgi:hypothetical protein